MIVLVCNAGSTSLKFKLFDMPAEIVLCEAKVERVGRRDSGIFSYTKPASGRKVTLDPVDIPGYTEGIRLFLDHMLSEDESLGVLKDEKAIERVGFKTVLAKGYYGVHVLTEPVIAAMREVLDVAPAHNGPYLEAIGHFQRLLPEAVLVGAFETAFHTTIPLERRIYGVPYEWYEEYGFQRMGYHGASHSYVADTVASLCGSTGKLISCHLGGSGSLCAVQDGVSVDSSFGYSLQTGLCHANRCGDLDPYLFPFLEHRGLTEEQVLEGLAKRGGLLGISGIGNDMRELWAAYDTEPRARLAIEHFANGVVKYIGAFFAELGGLDNLVFTGGIGEHDARFRHLVLSQIPHLGIQEAEAPTALGGGIELLSAAGSPVRVLAIPANEELGVARKTFAAE